MKPRGKRVSNSVLSAIIVLVLFGCLGSLEAAGATYYISPTGSDSNPGSSTAPWKTFSYAVSKLTAGCTLIVKNGTYTGGYVLYLSGKNGTASSPIVVKAENERQAFLSGNGSLTVLDIESCSYVIIEGLRVKSTDNAINTGEDPNVKVRNSNHITLRRLLVHNSNRNGLNSLIAMYNGSNNLVEECEGYYFHRYFIITKYGSSNEFRRNYANGASYPDISGGVKSDHPQGGDGGITVYPGSSNLIENNIVENTGAAFSISAYGTSFGNKWLGDIAGSGNDYGFWFVARQEYPGLAGMPQDTYVKDCISVGANYYGVYARSNKNTEIYNFSAINNKFGGIAADKPSSAPGDGYPTFYSTDSLAYNNKTNGLYIVGHSDFRINYHDSIGHSTNYYPSASSYQFSNEMSVDPKLGACRCWIPDGSPMNGAGIGGDIGANILYRYEKGSLTSIPLWNSDGSFPHGAVVSGINNVAGASAFDVHKRLNVNTNGCPFPAGYHGQ
jgi:hypothetical protein